MSNKQVHVAEVKTITPAMAVQILSEDLFGRQRQRAASHVGFLLETMERGEFDTGSPLRFGRLDGKLYLIDGQHRLAALIQYKKTMEWVVITTECDTADHLAPLYARIDRGRGRSIADALRALGAYAGSDLTSTQVQIVMACAPIFATNLVHINGVGAHYNMKSAEGRAATMEPWKAAACAYFDAISGASVEIMKLLHRRSVAVVGIATFADAPANLVARDFWSGVAKDDGLSAIDPRKQALEFFRKTNPSRSGPAYLAHGAAACWNAWFREDTLKLVKVYDAAAPLGIRGTRFKGKQESSTAPTRLANLGAQDAAGGGP